MKQLKAENYKKSLLKQATVFYSLTISIHQVETWCYADKENDK